MSNEEIIKKIIVDKGNFEHIAKTGSINGSLYHSIKDALRKARIDTIKQCAERANTHKTGNSGSWFDASVDKKSILSLIDEIQ